ncbi:MAG: hypothetical protein WKF58_06760 [Ilumatobacteraceae bacterium]
MIDGELDDGGGGALGHQFSPTHAVDDRAQRAVWIPPHGEVAVAQRRVRDHDTVGGLDDGERRDGEPVHRHERRGTTVGQRLRGGVPLVELARQLAVELDELEPRPARGVGDVSAGARWRHVVQQRGDPGLELAGGALEHLLRIGVDPRDGRPGQDVVELLGQHLAPLVVDVGLPAGDGSPQLGLEQQPLAAAVAELRLDLARERGAMGLEVELATPHGRLGAGGDLGVDEIEVVRRAPDVDRGHAVEVGEPARSFEHVRGGSTATVAVSERHQRVTRPAVIREVGRREGELFGRHLCVVRVDGREVREHPCAVESLPPERVVREPVRLVPRELLCHESGDAGGGEHLREPGRIAEHVGDPDLGAAHAEARLEVALAEHELTNDRLARRKVHVGLDPHPADRDELPTRDVVADALEQGGVVLLDPGVVLGLRAHEAVVRVSVHHRHGRRERPAALAPRLADRPQPCGVDVGVPAGDDVVRARSGRDGEQRLHAARRSDNVRQHIERGDDAVQQLRSSRVTFVEGAHHTVEDVEVGEQRRCGHIDEHEIGTAETVDRRLRRGVQRAHRRGPELREGRVRGRLHRELDILTRRVDGDGLASRVDALDRDAARVQHQSLALEARRVRLEPEIDERLNGSAAPRRRDLAAETEPGGRPRRSPAVADGYRRELLRIDAGVDGERLALAVDERRQPFRQLTRDPLLEQPPIVVHARTLPRA